MDFWYRLCCILSKFYIKPQLSSSSSMNTSCCILSKFYIKPQQRVRHKIGHSCCILSKFYIKPQLNPQILIRARVVSYRNSTSNHNHIDTVRVDYMLYLIEILHQTTTQSPLLRQEKCCILSKFYIKPQRASPSLPRFPRCILSKFYIKPQLPIMLLCLHSVVSYRNSTSNHNYTADVIQTIVLYLIEILHQTTTKRHTQASSIRLYLIEILHQTTTLIFASGLVSMLYLIEILHQTTTLDNRYRCKLGLYLIEILHQTTTC